MLYDASTFFQFICLLTSPVGCFFVLFCFVFFFCRVKVYFYVVRFISLLLLLEFLVKIRKPLPILRLYESSYVFLVSALFFYV